MENNAVIEQLRATTGDRQKARALTVRGLQSAKFSEACEALGFADAVAWAQTLSGFAPECLLVVSYLLFLVAEAELFHNQNQ